MRLIKFLVLLIPMLLLSVTHSYAQTVGTLFTIDGITYKVTKKELTSNDKQVAISSIQKSGAVTIPEKVQNQQDKEFYLVTSTDGYEMTVAASVTSISLPSKLEKISEGSFNRAEGLTTIKIPTSCVSIENYCFSLCPKLTSFVVESNNPNFSSNTQGMLLDKARKKLVYLPRGIAGELSIPNGVTEVGINAIYRCEKLTTLHIPASVTTMHFPAGINSGISISGSGAYIKVDANNTAYKDINGVLFTKDTKKLCSFPHKYNGYSGSSNLYVLPNETEEIANYAFFIANVTSVDLNNVKKLGSSAFEACGGLTTAIIGKNVESINEGAFRLCYSLSAFNVNTANMYFQSKEGVLFTKNGEHLVQYPTSKTGDYTVPMGTKCINASAFLGVKYLKTIHIAPTVERFERNAFRFSNVEHVIFDPTSSLKFMGYQIFNGSKIERITLPASLETMDRTIFYDCDNLKEVFIEDGSKLTSIPVNTFSKSDNLTTVKFLGSTSVTSIGNAAFAHCPKLRTFDVPKTVNSIGQNAFLNTPSLQTVTFQEPPALQIIGTASFAYSGVKDIKLPEGIKEIKQQAFDNCKNLTTIGIPTSVTKIETGTFNMCENLKAINVSKANPTYSSVDGFLLSKNKEKLIIFPAGKASTYYTMLPPTIKEISDYSFYYIQKLENVTIPKLVNKIGAHAFDMCKKLNTIAFLGEHPIPATNVDGTAFANIDKAKIGLSVREDSYNEYTANTLWNQFGVIIKSFKVNADGNGNVEYFPLSKKAVSLVDVQSDVFTLIVPKTVKNGATDYAVKLIADYAFDACKTNVNEVVVKADVDYIGIKAFQKKNGTTTVKNAFFIGTTPAVDLSSVKWELTDPKDVEFTTQKIYVKKSVENAYKKGWKKYANQIDYRIPDVKIAKKYGTFAREFDADFSEYYKEKNGAEVAAFVAGSSILPGGGDYGTSTYHVKMWSIDVKGGVNGNYGYVPAYTGVLLKVLDKESSPSDFYYTIGEQDNRTYNVSDNIMHGITVRNERVEASATEPVYVMQGGVFRKATADIGSFSVHKAYMKPGTLPAGAKVMLVFDDTESSATGIETVVETGARKEDNVYYNLNGQRVDNPRHGVYIRNGKKVIIK